MPSGIAFLPDGKTALLSRYGDHQIAVLRIAGTAVTLDKRPITTGLAPYTLDITADGTLAAVGNMGRGDGDVDTVSLIDLTAEPFRTVQTLAGGPLAGGAEMVAGRQDPGDRRAGRHDQGAGQPVLPPERPPAACWRWRARRCTRSPRRRSGAGTRASPSRATGARCWCRTWSSATSWCSAGTATRSTPRPALDVGAGPAAIMTSWK